MSPAAPTNRVQKVEIQDEAAGNDTSASLEVKLPSDAKVFVNDRLTSTPGEVRRYVSRNLKLDTTYTYEVRAELERDGEILELTQTVELRAGTQESIEFDFEESEPVLTTLTLNVPEDARVTLGGAETRASGDVREFSTNQLKSGQVWRDYVVVVSIERDGQTVTQEKMINLKAGDVQELDFEFDSQASSTQLASFSK